MWDKNCFVTLTYAPGHLPPNASLEHNDYQRFMKRVRKHYQGRTIRYYMCGEYGEQQQRPHYHACLFNVDFREDRQLKGKSGSGFPYFEQKELTRLWPHGFATVQDLVPETASYCARYIMKKALGEDAKTAYDIIDEDGVITRRAPEYSAMSLKPGIGAAWYDKYKRDVYPHDFVIQNGQQKQVPRYYDKLLKREKAVILDEIEHARQLRGQAAAPDNTDARRLVRETVHLAKVSTLKRNLE